MPSPNLFFGDAHEPLKNQASRSQTKNKHNVAESLTLVERAEVIKTKKRPRKAAYKKAYPFIASAFSAL